MQRSHDIAHSRKQFQIDRIAFFSDAVIAIAITLMILEVKMPSLGTTTPVKEIFAKYQQPFIIHFAALFICFFTIGHSWIKHHELFEHIINYNKQLIIRNLYFLLSIIVLPVSIGFMFDEDSPMQLKLGLFFFNLGMCNFYYYRMLVYVFHQKNNFSSLSDIKKIKQSKRAALLFFLVFFSAMAIALINPSWSYLPFIIGPAVRLTMRVYSVVGNRLASKKAHSPAER